MKVEIDSDLCTGAAVCEAICPEVFEVGEDDIAQVIDDDPSPSLWSQIKEAAKRCPSRAIIIKEN